MQETDIVSTFTWFRMGQGPESEVRKANKSTSAILSAEIGKDNALHLNPLKTKWDITAYIYYEKQSTKQKRRSTEL